MKSPSIRETELFMDVPKNRVGGIACITSGAAARALGFNKDKLATLRVQGTVQPKRSECGWWLYSPEDIGKVKSYLEEQIDGPT
jgi:hypothetical protein